VSNDLLITKNKAIELETMNIYEQYKTDMIRHMKNKKEEAFIFYHANIFCMAEFRNLFINIEINYSEIFKGYNFIINIVLYDYRIKYYYSDDEYIENPSENVCHITDFKDINLENTEQSLVNIIKHIVIFISNFKDDYYFCKYSSMFQKKNTMSKNKQEIMINKIIYNIDNICICCHDECDLEKLLNCCKCSVCLICLTKIKSCPNCREKFYLE
jgi:hypothetical protein